MSVNPEILAEEVDPGQQGILAEKTESGQGVESPLGLFGTIKWSITAALKAFKDAPLPSLLLILLWANLNTGPWTITSDLTDLTSLRSCLPYVLGPLAIIFFLTNMHGIRRGSGAGAVIALLIYGLFALLFSFNSPGPVPAFYFGLVFVATVLTSMLFMAKNTEINQLAENSVQLTWVIEAAFAIVVVYYARSALFSPERESAYNILTDLQGQSRSTGVARFIAIPAILALSRAWHGKGVSRFLLIPVFVTLAGALLRLESRGAIFGLGGAACFILISGRISPKYIVAVVVLMAAIFFAASIGNPSDNFISETVMKHITRGQSDSDLVSMTGRTSFWKRGWEVMWDSGMFFGFGNQADRYLAGGHIHNTWLQALMFGGLIGFVFFLLSWIITWINIVQVFFRRALLNEGEWLLFHESAAIWIFFTIRAVPETTNASFAVDLLVMCPIMVYFGYLATKLKRKAPLPGEIVSEA